MVPYYSAELIHQSSPLSVLFAHSRTYRPYPHIIRAEAAETPTSTQSYEVTSNEVLSIRDFKKKKSSQIWTRLGETLLDPFFKIL